MVSGFSGNNDKPSAPDLGTQEPRGGVGASRAEPGTCRAPPNVSPSQRPLHKISDTPGGNRLQRRTSHLAFHQRRRHRGASRMKRLPGFSDFALKLRRYCCARSGRPFPISASDLGDLAIPLPNRKAQAELIARLVMLSEVVERLKVVSRRKLAALDEMKQSLLHQAGHGRL